MHNLIFACFCITVLLKFKDKQTLWGTRDTKRAFSIWLYKLADTRGLLGMHSPPGSFFQFLGSTSGTHISLDVLIQFICSGASLVHVLLRVNPCSP